MCTELLLNLLCLFFVAPMEQQRHICEICILYICKGKQCVNVSQCLSIAIYYFRTLYYYLFLSGLYMILIIHTPFLLFFFCFCVCMFYELCFCDCCLSLFDF